MALGGMALGRELLSLELFPDRLEVRIAAPAAKLAGDDLTGERRDELDILRATEGTGRQRAPHRRYSCSQADQSAGSGSSTSTPSSFRSPDSQSLTRARTAAGLSLSIPWEIASP
jgi:hypothetical protein